MPVFEVTWTVKHTARVTSPDGTTAAIVAKKIIGGDPGARLLSVEQMDPALPLDHVCPACEAAATRIVGCAS